MLLSLAYSAWTRQTDRVERCLLSSIFFNWLINYIWELLDFFFFCTSSESMLRETRWKMKSREWHRLRSGELSCLISSWFKCCLIRQRTQACGIKKNSALNITCLHISIVPKWVSRKHVFKIPSFLCPSWSIAAKDYSIFALLMELKR